MPNKYEQKALIIDVESLIPNIQKRVDALGKQAELEKDPAKGNALIKKFNEYGGSLSFLEDNLKIFKERNALVYIDELIKTAEAEQIKAFEAKSETHFASLDKHIRKLKLAKDLISYKEFPKAKDDVPTGIPAVSSEQLKAEKAPLENEKMKNARERINDISFNEKEKQLLAEIIRQGGFMMHSSLPPEFTDSGHGGFQNKSDQSVNSEKIQTRLIGKHLMEDNGIDELLNLSEETITNEKIVEIPRTGFLGRKLQPEQKREFTTRPVYLDELVSGKSHEPASSLNYIAMDGTLDKIYPVPDGRIGNVFILKMFLPKSLGVKIIEQVKANPKFIREIADQLVVRELNIPADAWFRGDKHTPTPLRPPYEEWKKLRGESKIYIDDDGKNSERLKPELVHVVK